MSQPYAECALVRPSSLFPFRARFALLFFFLLASIVVYPYAESSGAGYYAFRVVNTIIILLTVYAVTFRRSLTVLVILLAVPSILQHLLFQPHSQGLLPFLNRMLALSFDLLIIGIVSRHIFQIEKPDSETIFGALCVYLLLGFMFSSIYVAIFSLDPSAFYLSLAGNLHLRPDRFDFIYFSFGTLTELGTPGIQAVAPVAKSVSLLEAIVGVLFMAVLISRLINAYGSRVTASTARPLNGRRAFDEGTENPLETSRASVEHFAAAYGAFVNEARLAVQRGARRESLGEPRVHASDGLFEWRTRVLALLESKYARIQSAAVRFEAGQPSDIARCALDASGLAKDLDNFSLNFAGSSASEDRQTLEALLTKVVLAAYPVYSAAGLS